MECATKNACRPQQFWEKSSYLVKEVQQFRDMFITSAKVRQQPVNESHRADISHLLGNYDDSFLAQKTNCGPLVDAGERFEPIITQRIRKTLPMLINLLAALG